MTPTNFETLGYKQIFDPKKYDKKTMDKEIKNDLRGILEPLGLKKCTRDYHITDSGYMVLH